MNAAHPVRVSEREAEVLAALQAELSNAQIANRLHITVRTVESHVSSLLRKYGVSDRRALAALAAMASTGARPPAHMAGVPAAHTTFIGRAGERDAVLTALEDGRLVTLLGPGGVGKSRLAAVIAETAAPSYPFGGAFVDLVPVRDGYVAQAVAATLEVTERSEQPLEHAITDRLGRGRSLLVLDSCEHLAGAAAAFAERVLSSCPGTRILVTSRERLRVPGEQTIPIGPLPLTPDAEQLYRDRATAADPGYTADPSTVRELCARLDGLPLAIELAAARSAALGTTGLLTVLEDYLRLLTGARSGDVRHRSIRAVIDWSHQLLDEDERNLFRQLASFVGWFDLDATMAVTGAADRGAVADVLGRLVDKSLVVYRPSVGRWRLLETVRAYALERLAESADRTEVADRYLSWAAATAAELEGQLGGRWRDRFDAVADDLRAASAAASPGSGTAAHRLARSLGHLTYARRSLQEAVGHYRHAAELAATSGEAARDLRSAADCAFVTYTIGGNEVLELLLDSAARAGAAGDGRARAIALARAVEIGHRFPARFATEIGRDQLGHLLAEATAAAGDSPDPVAAASLAIASAWHTGQEFPPQPSLADTAVTAARATGDPVLVSASLDAAGSAARGAWRLQEAYRISRDRSGLLAATDRNDPYAGPEIVDMTHLSASAALAVGDLRSAVSAGRRRFDDELIGESYGAASDLVHALVLTGEFDQALEHAIWMWDGWERAGRPAAGQMTAAVAFTALAHGLLGDHRGFTRWRGRVLELTGTADPELLLRLSSLAFVDARVAVHTRDLTDAAALVDRAFGDLHPGAPSEPYAHAAAAELAVVAGLSDAADRLVAATTAATENLWAAACLARATGRRDGDRDALTASIEDWERIGARFERACTLLLLPDREPEGQAELAALARSGPPSPRSGPGNNGQPSSLDGAQQPQWNEPGWH